MNNTVYIVSGYMRTGTSMMMKALEAGGLTAVYRPSRDTFRKSFADELYDPNEGGLYELEANDYRKPGFPRDYQGKLIKCLLTGINEWAPMPKIKCVFMRRDYEEIRQSYLGFFDQTLPLTKAAFQHKVDSALATLENRKDTDYDVLWMREVINDPLAAFTLLKEHGWPIDPHKAAAVVNPELYRFRKELLTEGIL